MVAAEGLRLSSEFHPYITDTLEYLGVKVSWNKCGDAVLQHRIRKAQGVFALLRPWWRTSALSSSLKARIYKTMVLPVLLYGLGSSGLSLRGEIRFKTIMIRQLRHIFRCPVHLTRESDSSFLGRIGFPLPSEYVMVECCRVARQLLPEINEASYDNGKGVHHALQVHSSCETTWLRCVHAGLCILLPGQVIPILADLSVPRLRVLLAGIPRRHLHQAWLTTRTSSTSSSSQAPSTGCMHHAKVVPDVQKDHVCQSCGREFATYTQLRSHQRHHACGWEDKKLSTFAPAVDARSDLPSCHWCGHKFLRWHGVKIHIASGQCPASDVREKFLAQETRPLPFYLDQDLSHHCVLCRRWFRFSRSLSCHLRAAHRDVYDEGKPTYAELDLSPAMKVHACIACGHISLPRIGCLIYRASAWLSYNDVWPEFLILLLPSSP